MFICCPVYAGEILGSKKYHRLYVPYYSGTCKSKTDNVYLNEALFIKNEIVKEVTEEGFLLKKIIRDMLVIESYNSNGELVGSYPIDVKSQIAKGNKKLSGIDIELSFVSVGGSFGVYWKESYLNRPYLQGVFNLKNNHLEWFCEGEGGLSMSH
jgi:hypothetical protein